MTELARQMMDGKVPPQETDLERALLGTLLMNNESIYSITDFFHADCFYSEANKIVFEVTLDLLINSRPADILTITAELKRLNKLDMVGGPFYISALTTTATYPSNIIHYARIIYEKYLQRELIRLGQEIQIEAYDETSDPFEILNKAEKTLTNLSGQIGGGKIHTPATLHQKFVEVNKMLRENKGVSGISTGFKNVDNITGGFQKTDLVILAAPTGCGKTSLVLDYARNAALVGKSVAIFSLEMSASQLWNRLQSQHTGMPLNMYSRYGLNTGDMASNNLSISDLLKANIFIDDTPGLSVFDFKTKSRKLKRERKIDLIILDYLQLMHSADHRGNREQEVSFISRSLKLVAKELDIPVIALSQLSRAVEARGGDKRPQLSDLRSSGDIEANADQVQFVYRPEYYKIESGSSGESTQGRAEVIIAKNRNGGLGTAKLKFHAEATKFSNIDETPF